MSSTTQHLESIGHLCSSLRVPYGKVRRAIEALEIKPALTLNGIAHFDEQQAERIANHLKQSQTTNAK